mgnify:FL=1
MDLRGRGVKTDCYVGEKSMGQQYAYAQKNGIAYVVTAQDDDRLTVKEIATRKMLEGITVEELTALVLGSKEER